MWTHATSAPGGTKRSKHAESGATSLPWKGHRLSRPVEQGLATADLTRPEPSRWRDLRRMVGNQGVGELLRQRGETAFAAQAENTQAVGGPAPWPPVAVQNALEASPGRSLSPACRRRYQRIFGANAGAARLHEDERAARAARSVHALAFTMGRDIFIDSTAISLATPQGDLVLAEELAHVLQARSSAAADERLGGGAAAPAVPPRHRDAVAGATDAVETNARAAVRAAYLGRSYSLAPAEPGVIYRAVSTECVAPSEIVDRVTAGAFGKIPETLIEADYCSKLGCLRFGTDFFDTGIGGLPWLAFLAAHNPGIDLPLVAGQVLLSGGVLIPDIATDLPGRREYYEIKPNSPDGLADGYGKLFSIAAFMHFNNLDYEPGTTYVPKPMMPIPLSGPALTLALGAAGAIALATCGPITASLEVEYDAPGLLVDRVCITADFACYAKVIGLTALIAAVIAVIIATGGLAGAAGAGAGAGAGGLIPVLLPAGALL